MTYPEAIRISIANHSTTFSPLGKLAPGVKDIGSMMAKMWDEMERDRFKYGCKTTRIRQDMPYRY